MWDKLLKEETGCFFTLNKFRYLSGDRGEYVTGEGWMPTSK